MAVAVTMQTLLTKESDGYTPSKQRSGIALCLSGGGYRAALFHLGALRRLNELRILSKVRTVSSVSGGSIVSALLASYIVQSRSQGRDLSSAEFEAGIATPLRSITSRNIRNRPLLKRFALPWNWFRRSTQVDALQEQYHRHLTKLSLAQLPDQPKFVFCSTELSCGVNWVFEQHRVGQYWLGYTSPPVDWSIAKAVAASSCFPPLFDPMTLAISPDELSGGKLEAGTERAGLVNGIRLSDGGVYDNLGLEPVWESHEHVLVSDGGAPFRFKPSTTVIRQWKRYFGIASNQVGALRKRWLVSNFEAKVLHGTYWGVGSAVSRYGSEFTEGYSKSLAANCISRIRTDLNRFTIAEQSVLENHGYILADVAMRKHVPSLMPTEIAPLRIPHENWSDEKDVSEALRDSNRVRLSG